VHESEISLRNSFPRFVVQYAISPDVDALWGPSALSVKLHLLKSHELLDDLRNRHSSVVPTVWKFCHVRSALQIRMLSQIIDNKNAVAVVPVCVFSSGKGR
jgi:hypothetical protein